MPGITAPQRARTSRRPSGLPNPPMILLAGPEKTGKSPQAALASTSDAIGMTYWIQIGGTSGTADFYGRIPGARYEIVEHDGSFADICDAIRWAMAQPPKDDKRNMIVVDDVTSLWDLLGDEVVLMSRKRADRRAQANGRRTARLDDPYVDEDRDLWSYAKDRWGEVLWLLRRHSGPTLLIARQELVTAYENDKPTRHTTRRIKAEKNLAAAVDAIVEFHAPGEAYVTGIHVTSPSFTPGKVLRYQDIDHLFRVLSYENAAPTRQVTESRPEAYVNEQQPHDQAQQRQVPAQQPRPELTGKQAVDLVHAALTDTTDPEARLLDLREEWGKRFLQRIPTFTKAWGEMDADALITRSLQHVKELAERKKSDARTGQPAQAGGQQHEPGPCTPPDQAEQELAGEHQAHDDHEPLRQQDQASEHDGHNAPGEHEEPTLTGEHQAHDDHEPPTEDDVPPPPDPQAEEPPPNESPEDTSAAEEPQDVPTAPPAPAPRQNRKAALALKALHAEADVQARVKMMTVGEHLGPISEEGDPSIIVLRNYLQNHRPGIIEQLESEGHTELAAYYRGAPTVDPQIPQKFAAYFEGAPAGQK
ncbi:hypothetical protein ABZ687_28815 [Streptomyces ardesiacus]|uniref:hypothetical protein n=1 Tax=Streptomyces ardesiacus TaxID=285564 RepID=UPI0033C253D9